MSGTRMSSTFDGRWVKTIVLSSPIRAAIRRRRQRRHRGQQVRPEEDQAEERRIRAVLDVEPVGHQALRDEAAAEGVEREQDRQLQHGALGSAEPEPAPDAIGRDLGRWRLDGRPEPPEPDHHREADHRVADDDRAIGVDGRRSAVDEGLAEQAGAERAGRGRDVADEVVPGERRRPAPVRDGLGQGGLLDGQERADLVAGRRDDADGAGQDQQRDEAREREDDPGQDHQGRTRDEHAAPPEPVGVGRQPQRDDRVADQRQGQDDPDRQRVEPDGREVEDQDDRQEAVAEHPERPHREQQAAVAIQPAQARDEARVRWAGGSRGRGGDRRGRGRRRDWGALRAGDGHAGECRAPVGLPECPRRLATNR